MQYESPISSGKKLLPSLKFFKSRSNFKVKVTSSKIMVPCERPYYNTHVQSFMQQYESSVSSGKNVMAKVKVFVHISNADVDADTRAMTLAPLTFVPVR